MQARRYLLLCAVVVVMAALFAATEVQAQNGVLLPRSCVLPAGAGNTVTIQAGPGATQFPVDVPCLAPFTGDCSRYDYRWIYSGLNPSHSFVTFARENPFVDSSPSATVSIPGAGDSQSGLAANVHEVLVARFNANTTTFNASIFTRRSEARQATAGFQSGNRSGFCLMAGPGVPIA
ncbi:MAG: hypothetical protein ACREBU_15620, partial [Nitrososphaera sp.]